MIFRYKIYNRIFLIVAALIIIAVMNSNALAGEKNKKVIIIGFDGMDPQLVEKLMDAGQMPNFDKLRKRGGYSPLGTSNPPQSPVAWSNFINGAGPGTHGIFDFIHRNPEKQCVPFYSAAETVEGDKYWDVGDYKLQIPFITNPTQTMLRRHGIPFWDYLDQAGIDSKFYDLPANYPPSPSKHHHHSCLSGMGTPDMLGTYGTYQHYSEDGPVRTKDEGGGKRSMLFFENETAEAKIIGPANDFLKKPEAVMVDFLVHRDKDANTAVIEIQKNKILLKKGQWSDWTQLEFEMSLPWFLPNEKVSGICRFYLQEVYPNFRLYVTPINIDPSKPAMQVTEPEKFIKEISSELGLFYTTGFQEDHKALSNKVFNDSEYVNQTQIVLEERLRLLDFALDNYKDGLLFFYFSSTDMQGHMFWWQGDEKHPLRTNDEAKKYHRHLKEIYRNMDDVVGRIIKQYDDKALIMLMSDHGFCNFKRQFNPNTWLRENGYLYPADSKSIMIDTDWSKTVAYGLGLNGLYINLKGRERDGIVESADKEKLMAEIIEKLKKVRDVDGKPVIRNVYRSDKVYQGPKTKLAPDLLVGYYRGFRASWSATLGDIDDEMITDNDSAWSADHCIDPLEVPGVLFSNRPLVRKNPDLTDIAPTVLTEFAVEIPKHMTGKNIFLK